MALEAVGSNPIIHPKKSKPQGLDFFIRFNIITRSVHQTGETMLKKVMIKITSRCEELSDSLFERFFGTADSFSEGDFDDIDFALEEALNAVADVDFDDGKEIKEPEDDGIIEIFTEGRLRITPDRFSLSYKETELTGMEGAQTTLSYSKSEPTLVSMLRTGGVNTALIFEPQKRHICSYQTPFMPFELCVRTLSMDNRLESDGEFAIEYVIEIRGATAEKNSLFLKIYDAE